MMYALIVLLICVLLTLLKWQKQNDIAWQQEWAKLKPNADVAPESEHSCQKTENTLPEESEVSDLPPSDSPSEQSEEKPEILDSHNPDSKQNPFTLFEIREKSPLKIIGLKEATRFLHRPLIESETLYAPPPDAAPPADLITDDDPNIIRVRQRTLEELRTLLKNEQNIPTPESEKLPEESNHQTIDLKEVQNNLAKKHQHLPSAPKQPDDVLPEIADEEVWANITRTPYVRHRKRHTQSTTTPRTVSTPKTQTPAPNERKTPSVLEKYIEQSKRQAQLDSSGSLKDLPDDWMNYVPYQYQNTVQNCAPEKAKISEIDVKDYFENQKYTASTPEYSPPKITPYSAPVSRAYTPSQRHRLPPLSLLLPPVHNPDAVPSQEALLENSIIIEEKLAEFRVKVKVLDAYAGPVITRYELEPDIGVRGNSVLNLEKDLARSLGMAAIRVVETIPNKTCMALELPNPKRQIIRLSEILNSPQFSGSHSKLTLALGQDIAGIPVITDLAKAPHLLVAGTTGSGKSVGVNAMILSMLYKASPEDVRLIMIDPKMLELSIYKDIPHLLAPVVTDMKLAANALTWCVDEMERRYRLMSHLGVRNIAGYNQKIRESVARGQKINNPFSLTPNEAEPLETLPFIVVVVDEFADLMMVAGKQIEQLIARLAQKARAAGIHLILATQRPSVDVITGLIKANIPTRIAFQVSTKIDSRTILDKMGAENLLGQGDMLFVAPGSGEPQRIHGAFVADGEVHAVVEYLKQMGAPNYIKEILNPKQSDTPFSSGSYLERDPLFDQAVEVIVNTKKASISSLQRHLRIGYNKAATLIEQLESEGIVSEADHTGKRTILARKPEQ